MKDELFFDTNIICYAHDFTERQKRMICGGLFQRVLDGEIIGVVSNQVLVELFNSLTRKLDVPSNKAVIIVRSLILSQNWKKINYDCETLDRALKNSEEFKTPFLDTLISETMKENGITEIITENERDFNKIPGIKVTNPLRQITTY